MTHVSTDPSTNVAVRDGAAIQKGRWNGSERRGDLFRAALAAAMAIDGQPAASEPRGGVDVRRKSGDGVPQVRSTLVPATDKDGTLKPDTQAEGNALLNGTRKTPQASTVLQPARERAAERLVDPKPRATATDVKSSAALLAKSSAADHRIERHDGEGRNPDARRQTDVGALVARQTEAPIARQGRSVVASEGLVRPLEPQREGAASDLQQSVVAKAEAPLASLGSLLASRRIDRTEPVPTETVRKPDPTPSLPRTIQAAAEKHVFTNRQPSVVVDKSATPELEMTVLRREVHLPPVRRMAPTSGLAVNEVLSSRAIDVSPSNGKTVDGFGGLLQQIKSAIVADPASEAQAARSETRLPTIPLPTSTHPVKVVELALQPASLGTLTVTLRLTSQGLRVTLNASTREAAAKLEDDRNALSELFAETGHDLEEVRIAYLPRLLKPAGKVDHPAR